MTTDDVWPTDGHVTDAELLAILDAEPTASPEQHAHVDACAECADRLARLRADAGLVTASLAALPTPPIDAATLRRRLAVRHTKAARRSAWRNPVVQIAAALVVATAAAASVGPIRGLIARRESGPVTPTPAPKRGDSASAGPSESAIAFAVSGPVLTVSFDSVPAGGTVDIEPTRAAVASAEAIDSAAGARADAMVVLPNELRLRNSGSSRASYRVMVPEGLERVRVVVGGRILVDGPPRRSTIGLSDRVRR